MDNHQEKPFLEVQIAPSEEHIKNSRWHHFKSWLRKLMESPRAQATKKMMNECLSEGYDCGIETARRAKIANTKTNVEIEQILINSRSSQDSNQRENSLFEQTYLNAVANARLTNAQAAQIEMETAIKFFDLAKERGFKVALTSDNGIISVIARDLEDHPETIVLSGAGVSQQMPVEEQVRGLKNNDMDYYDIPDFLRKQAD